MSKYKLSIDQDALQDIQSATDWYNEKLKGLGSRFQKQVKAQINSLKSNPATYSNRYGKLRCMLIKKFPFLVHYYIDETKKLVVISALFHTSRNPKIWKKRRSLKNNS